MTCYNLPVCQVISESRIMSASFHSEQNFPTQFFISHILFIKKLNSQQVFTSVV